MQGQEIKLNDNFMQAEKAAKKLAQKAEKELLYAYRSSLKERWA